MNWEFIRYNFLFPFYLLHSIWFNFRFLKFKEAIKLPILLYKPHFLNLRDAKIRIEGKIYPGMIQIGFYRVPLYPNNGCIFQVRGNIIFKGKTKIGNNSSLIVGKQGNLTFGENFNSTSTIKIVCMDSITFKDNVLVGWDNLFIDYDFHSTSFLLGGKNKGYGKINIGNNVWFTNGCRTYKNIDIPNNTIISSNTIIKKLDLKEEYTLVGNNNSITIFKQGVYHNHIDDKINLI